MPADAAAGTSASAAPTAAPRDTAPGASSGGVLLVHAHPDDECAATGGTIARAVSEGRRVDLVICTNGEEGEVHDPGLDPEEARPRLRDIRLEELACSVSALGGGRLNLHLLGYRDSGMMDTEANNHPDAFWQADLTDAARRLVKIVRAARPSVLIGYDSNGGYGHPDHINAHRIAARAFDAAADPSCYPDAGAPHAVDKLYEVAFNREAWFALMTEMRERGIRLPWGFDEEFADGSRSDVAATGDVSSDAGSPGDGTPGDWSSPTAERPPEEVTPTSVEALRKVGEELEAGEIPEEFGTPEAEITTRVDVGPWLDAKRASMDCHRTQRQDLGWLLELPDDLVERAMGTEFYVLRRWRDHDVTPDLRETDLFDGL